MSFNGTGTFLINTAGQPVVASTVISATTFNLLTADLANGLTNTITKDGQTTVTANIPMSNFKITGLGAATTANDAVRLEQLTSGATNVSFGNLAYTGTLTGGTGVVNLGSGQVYKDASGNVGIGTTTPSYRLDVTRNGGGGDSAQLARFTDSNTSNSVGPLHLTLGATNHFAGNPGIVLAGTNGIALAVGDGSDLAGQRKLTIDSSGNVGIGTSSPNQRLQVTGSNSTGFAGATLQNSNGNVGLAGVQFSSDTTYSKSAIAQVRESPNGAGPLVFYVDSATDAADWSAGDEKMRIDSNGKLLVGSSTNSSGNPTAFFVAGATDGVWITNSQSVSSTSVLWNKGTTGDNVFETFCTEASLTVRGSISYNRAGGLVAYNVTSDRRAKDILGEVSDSGAIIDLLKVYSGMMKGATIARPMLIADEAQEVTPYAVTGKKDAVDKDGSPVFQQMDVSSYVPLLIAELQSLRKRVAELESI